MVAMAWDEQLGSLHSPCAIISCCTWDLKPAMRIGSLWHLGSPSAILEGLATAGEIAEIEVEAAVATRFRSESLPPFWELSVLGDFCSPTASLPAMEDSYSSPQHLSRFEKGCWSEEAGKHLCSGPSQPDDAALLYKLLQKVWELSPTTSPRAALADVVSAHSKLAS